MLRALDEFFVGLASVLLGEGICPDGVTASSESDASRSQGILLRGRVRMYGFLVLLRVLGPIA